MDRFLTNKKPYMTTSLYVGLLRGNEGVYGSRFKLKAADGLTNVFHLHQQELIAEIDHCYLYLASHLQYLLQHLLPS